MRARQLPIPTCVFALVLWSASAATPARLAPADALANRLMAAVACREEQVVPGPGSVFAIRSGGLSGDVKLELYDAKELPDAHRPSPLATVPSGVVALPFWSRKGDLIVYDAGFAWLDAGRIARRTFSPFGEISILPFLPVVQFPDDVGPLQVTDHVALAGSGRERTVLDFSPDTGAITRTAMAVGFKSALAWNGDGFAVRIRGEENDVRIAERFDEKAAAWRPFATLPRDSRVIFLRQTRGRPELGLLVADEEMDRIVVLDAGRARTIASGQFSHVIVAADRSAIYGTLDREGVFSPVADAWDNPRIAAWLPLLAGRRGVIDIGFPQSETYALVKSQPATEAPRIDLLSRHGVLGVRAVFSLCAGVDRGVAGSESDGNDVLLLPREPRRDALVVYLHGGPFDYFGSGGHWITDFYNLAGYPVVAVNYSGSDGRPLHAEDERKLGAIYGAEVSAAVAFAEKKLGGKKRPLIFVADSFGSLVGLAAIAQGAARPSQFVVLDGVVDALDLSPSGHLPGGNAAAHARYFEKALRDLAFRLKPDAISAAAPTTRFFFVHGEKDDVAPLERVRQFVAAFNASRPAVAARVVTIPGMYHEPIRKTEMDAIVRALEEAMRESQ